MTGVTVYSKSNGVMTIYWKKYIQEVARNFAQVACDLNLFLALSP